MIQSIDNVLLSDENIYDWQKTVDIGQLGKLEHLRELHIDGNYDSENINPITELKGFPVLTDLKIGDLLNDLSEIKHLPALTRLTLTNPINIGMIQSAVPKLEILDFYANHISDLQPLSFLQSVDFLEISRVHKINDFTPIGKLRSLTRLKLDSCDLLTNINFLGKSQPPVLYRLAKEANFIISNDTGPAHMAAHLGARGVTLFGYHTTPKKVSIETNKFKAIIKDDLKELSAEEVYSNISEELSLV